MSAEPSATPIMPSDTEILDWIQLEEPHLNCDENGIWTLSTWSSKSGNHFYFKNSVREVIDEAMQAEEKK